MTNEHAVGLRTACQEFLKGWSHFLEHINFAKSNLDADSIRFMNEVPGQIEQAVDASLERKVDL